MMWRVATFIFVGSLAGLLGTWVADRQPPTEIISFKLMTPVVPPGGELKIAYYVFRNRSCATTFQRTYRDGDNPPARHALDDIVIASSPANPGWDEYTTVVPISVKAMRGKASYRPIILYRCNPIHLLWPIVQIPGNVDFQIAGEPVPGALEVIPRR